MLLEENHLNLNDLNGNMHQFADIYYYFERHLITIEISNRAKYHLSSVNNSVRVCGTLEVDNIVCNSIVEYYCTHEQVKKLTYEISWTLNLQKALDGKKRTIDNYVTVDRVVVTNAN